MDRRVLRLSLRRNAGVPACARRTRCRGAAAMARKPSACLSASSLKVRVTAHAPDGCP